MNDSRAQTLGVRYYGELADGRNDMIVDAILVGLFKPILEDGVTPVNARQIAAAPAFTVQMFRRTLARMANPLVTSSLAEEALTQSMVFASQDYAEMKAARAEKREPRFRNR